MANSSGNDNLFLMNNWTNYNQTNNSTVFPQSQTPFAPSVQLQIVSWLALAIMIASIIINGLCLIAFYKESALRTVFNYYLINLTIADLTYACCIPFYILDNYSERTPLQADLCAFKVTVSWTVSSVAVHTVMLIGFDRLWAVCWPHHYRQNKSKKLSGGIIAGTWCWILACMLPGIIADRIQTPYGQHCDIEMDTPFKMLWGQIINFLSFLLPIVLLIFSYIIIAIKLHQVSAQKALKATTTNTASHWVTEGPEKNSGAAAAAAHARTKKDRKVLKMFGYLTLSIVLLWLPGDIFYPIISFLPDLWTDQVQAIMDLSLYASTVINPLVYQIAGNEMSTAIKSMGCCKKGKKNRVRAIT